MPPGFSARVARDLGDAARQLRGDRFYSAVLITTMTVGIAAAAAIFSVVRGVILRPLPYRDANAVVALQEFQPAALRDETSMSVATFTEVRASAKSFEALSAFANAEFVLSDGAIFGLAGLATVVPAHRAGASDPAALLRD